MVNQINLINKGNSALGVQGLEKQIMTSNLIQQRSVEEVVVERKDINELLKPILDTTNRLKILTYTIAEDRESVAIQTEVF